MARLQDISNPQVDTVENIAEQPDAEPELQVHIRTWVALLAINLVAFAQIITLIGVGVLARSISTLFGDPGAALWPTAILSIFTVALNPPLAQAADYWGRKWVLLTCSVSSFVGHIVVSRAHNMGTALVGFCFIGPAMGPQFAYLAVVSEILPRKYRAMAQATVNMSTGLGATVGLLATGALLRGANLENYRIYFYMAAAVWILGGLGIAFGYRPPPRELQVTLTLGQKLASLDWIGIFLSTAGLTLFSLGLFWYDNPYSFSAAAVLAPLVIGLIFLLAFAGYEWRIKKDGIAHHSLFRHRNFPLALLILVAEGVAFFTINSYLIFEQTVVMGSDIWIASLRGLIYYTGSIAVIALTGFYTTRTKRLRDPLILGFATYTAFAAGMTTVKPTTTGATICGLVLLATVSNGLIILNVVVAAQMVTPREMIAVTTGLLVAARGAGGAIGTAVNTAIFNNTLKSHLGPSIAAAVVPLGFPAQELGAFIGALTSGNQALLASIPGLTPSIIAAATRALQNTYALAFRYCWFISVAFLAVSCLLSCFISNVETEFNAHIDAPAEDELAKTQHDIDMNKIGVGKQNHAGSTSVNENPRPQRVEA